MTTQTELYQSPAYKRSRNAYTLECAFEYFVALLVSGAFLAKLLTYLGISDSLTGIISSLISLAFLFQLFSIFVVQRIVHTKRFIILFHTIGQLCFMSLYLIPFLPFAKNYREPLVVICILLAYFGNYFVNSMLFKWANSHVDPNHRAMFSGVKEMISLVTGIIVSLAAGAILDRFEAQENLEGGFLFLAISILIFTVCDLVCLLLIRGETKSVESHEVTPMRDVLHATVGNKSYRNVIILHVLWYIGYYMTTGFLGTYQVNPHELAFSVGIIQIFQLIANLGRFGVTPLIGRFSDRTSYAHGIRLALMLTSLAFLLSACITPGTRYLVPVYMILLAAGNAGIGQNFLNITYSYVDQRFFAQAMAIKNCIGGVCGFLASLVASRILAFIQANGNSLFGLSIYGQQLLSIISFVIILIAVVYDALVIEKQKPIRQ